MIKDLFIVKNNYKVEYVLTENLYLFIEGLTNLGETITNNEFNIDNIENILVELHDKNGYVCHITLELTDMLEWIKDYVLEELTQKYNKFIM